MSKYSAIDCSYLNFFLLFVRCILKFAFEIDTQLEKVHSYYNTAIKAHSLLFWRDSDFEARPLLILLFCMRVTKYYQEELTDRIRVDTCYDAYSSIVLKCEVTLGSSI